MVDRAEELAKDLTASLVGKDHSDADITLTKIYMNTFANEVLHNFVRTHNVQIDNVPGVLL